MIAEPTPLPGLLVLRPQVFRDARGWFLESFNARRFTEITGHDTRFVQDNESLSAAGVVRGLHYQVQPHEQGKLVRVINGAVLDVCLDIRPGSPTFGKHFALRLDGDGKTMLWIPPGFAHGFRTLADGTVFSYKCTAFYEKSAERTILWNDPALGIDWGISDPVLSEKDRNGTPFKEFVRLVNAD
ncbi:MAG: dTDP-4-dehydrorhamnose 3,5-epimerase [Flavobacteriales bacterium]